MDHESAKNIRVMLYITHLIIGSLKLCGYFAFLKRVLNLF